jgi:hypothetical protein
MGDLDLSGAERLTWATASSALVKDRALLEAGLLGPVSFTVESP